jgi:hypothetical protein
MYLERVVPRRVGRGDRVDYRCAPARLRVRLPVRGDVSELVGSSATTPGSPRRNQGDQRDLDPADFGAVRDGPHRQQPQMVGIATRDVDEKSPSCHRDRVRDSGTLPDLRHQSRRVPCQPVASLKSASVQASGGDFIPVSLMGHCVAMPCGPQNFARTPS